MKVFVKSDKNLIPHNYNFMNAYQGFREMGFEVIPFYDDSELSQSNKEDIVVGYVETVRNRLNDFGIITPEIDYPVELRKYLGRKIWKCRMSEVSNNPECWPVFIKPLEDKQFTGTVINSTKDLIGCGLEGMNQEIFCSEPINLVAEWRCFIRYGHILSVRPYKGDWRSNFDYRVIESAVSEFVSAPAGYSIDFGLTDNGKTVLIEVNDGYALGCYGLYYLDYAKLLSARWAELTSTEDECNFDLMKF